MTLREQIEAAVAKATKGRWRVDESRDGRQNQQVESFEEVSTDHGTRVASLHITAWKQGARDARPDAHLIVLLRNNALRLAAAEGVVEAAKAVPIQSLPDELDARGMPYSAKALRVLQSALAAHAATTREVGKSEQTKEIEEIAVKLGNMGDRDPCSYEAYQLAECVQKLSRRLDAIEGRKP